MTLRAEWVSDDGATEYVNLARRRGSGRLGRFRGAGSLLHHPSDHIPEP